MPGLADALMQPDGIDPELLKQLMGLGSVDQRYKLLQEQGARGDQLAGGVPIDYRHGKGTPQLLASLANLLSAGVGGYQEGKAVSGQRSLVDEATGARSAFSKALMGANQPVPEPPADFVGPPTQANDPASLETKRQGLLGTLRGAGLMSGDPTITGALMHGPQIAAEEQKLANERPQAALGGQPPNVFEALTKRKTAEAASEKVSEVAVNPLTGALYDKRTGKNVSGGGSGASDLTPEALDQLAEMFHTTGALPPVGRGASAAMTIKKIVNRAADLHPDASLAGNKAGFKADTGSLAKLQTQADSIESFENTALKNLDNFLKTAGGVIDTGSPLFNKPLRSLDSRVLGDVNTAKFNTARQVAVQEIGKVLGGAVQGGAISDSQRHEVESLLSGDMSLAQIRAAADVLKQDMANRKTAVNEQLGAVRARVSGQKTVTPAASPAAPERKTVGGKTYEKRADGWYEVTP